MEADPEFQLTAKKLREMGQERLSLQERKLRRRALDSIGVPEFGAFLAENGVPETALRRGCCGSNPKLPWFSPLKPTLSASYEPLAAR